MNYGFAFFPGQGAQAPGMGKDLYENSQAAKLVFEEASEGAGLDVAKLCFESDKATLSRTENSQIAIFTHSMAAWAALKEAGVEFKAAAGFSLGEYTALAAAGVVSLADGVKIVSMRGKLMQQAADSIDGGMAAILGLEDSVIEEACAKVTSGVVRPVNYNCPGQLVIGGEKAAVEQAAALAKEAGARRCIPLKVSGPFHTKLMAPAGDALAQRFAGENFGTMETPVLFNCLGHEKAETDSIPQLLVKQVQSSVYMEDTLRRLGELGVDHILEVGPGNALSGFVKKTLPGVVCTAVETPEQLDAVLTAWKDAE